jgi:class 3 adenylate cyclase
MPEERRLVTVLFADVVGSTALGESLDPEDLRRLLGRFYETARDVMQAHGGTLEKFIGDAALAIFGIPAAHDDDPRRALDAALELRRRLQADTWLSEHAPVRIGINTGDVVASGDRTSGDFIVTGDPVNVAARLQQHAEAWQILVTERAARAAGDGFTFGEQVGLALRGKSEDVLAMPLTGHASRERRRIPLVGRNADVSQLELVARRAFEERRPFLVSLIAPAGTGKTRLLEEFLDRLPQVAPNARVVTAQCLPYGQRLTYWPMRALQLALLDLPDTTEPEQILEAARAWLQRAGAENPERTASMLAATIGASEAEVLDRSTLFDAWRTTIELAAAERPLVLVIEDLHWSSDSLLDLVEYILQPRADAPLLMVALMRPELLDRRPSWGGGRRNYVALALEPLDDASVGTLVEHMLDGPAPELVRGVVERADGNPFYAGEIVRSILERATALDDPKALATAIATLPDTVQATVLARLDLLEPVARRALQLGSVFGRSFRVAGIAALDDRLAADPRDTVEGLLDRDLIRPSGPDEVVFRHILIREVAYQTLPRAERARLHAAAGRWLEGQAAGREEELAELIAFHFREAAVLHAASLEPDAALEVEAVRWLRRAGETATAASATIEAARHLQAAIDLAGPELLPELYLQLGDAYASGDLSVNAYADALRLGREQGRPPDFLLRALGNMLMVRCRWYASVGQQGTEADLVRQLDEGRALLPQVSDERVRAAFLIATGFVPFWLANTGQREPNEEDFRTAEANGAAGLAIAERIDDPRLISAALDAAISSLQRVGPVKAREISRRRVAMGDRLDLTERLDAAYMVAWSAALLGDLDETLATTQRAGALVQPGQNPAFAVGSACWRAYALSIRGEWDEMAAALERGRQLWFEAGRTAAGYAIHGFLAGIDVAQRRGDDAFLERWREVAEEILARFQPSHPTAALRSLVALDMEGIADIVGHPERYSERYHILERAMTLAADRAHLVPVSPLTMVLERCAAMEIRIVEAQARRLRGMLIGDIPDLRRSLELFQSMRARPYEARVLTELGLASADEALVREGVSILDELGEVEQLARIRQRQAGA